MLECLRMARPGDMVILTPTRIDAVWRQVLDYAPSDPDATEAPDALSDPEPPLAPADAILEPAHG